MSWKVSKVTRTPVTDGEQGLLSRMVDKVTKTPVTDGGQGLLSWKVHRRGIFNWHKVKGVIRTDKQFYFWF